MSSAFLPSDRWGRNIQLYTSDTKKREQTTSVLSLGALGCAAVAVAAFAYSWLFPAVAEPLLSSASQLATEMQGLRAQNALLRAHLRRLTSAQEALLPPKDDHDGNRTRTLAVTSMRRLLSDTTSLLAQQEAREAEPNQRTETGIISDEQVEASLRGKRSASELRNTVSTASAPMTTRAANENYDSKSVGQYEESHPHLSRLHSVIAVGSGMIRGVQELSYNVFKRVVNGPDKRDVRRQHRPRQNKGDKGTGWRKRHRKEAQKQQRQMKAARAPSRQRLGHFPKTKKRQRL